MIYTNFFLATPLHLILRLTTQTFSRNSSAPDSYYTDFLSLLLCTCFLPRCVCAAFPGYPRGPARPAPRSRGGPAAGGGPQPGGTHTLRRGAKGPQGPPDHRASEDGVQRTRIPAGCETESHISTGSSWNHRCRTSVLQLLGDTHCQDSNRRNMRCEKW